MILHINTSDMKRVDLVLEKKGETIVNLSEDREYGSQVLLPLIIKLLDQEKIYFKDLTEIKVNTGPGSFTGIRVGVSVANALGYSLGILVNGKKIETDLLY